MADLSYYESRTGTLSCSGREVYDFVTDLRNFGQFIPEGKVSSWKAENNTCSFNISMAGTITVRLKKKEPYAKVIFDGDALKKNDFSLALNISNSKSDNAEVRISLEAELNPMLKMVADKPIVQFLELLIVEMEKFRSWSDIIK